MRSPALEVLSFDTIARATRVRRDLASRSGGTVECAKGLRSSRTRRCTAMTARLRSTSWSTRAAGARGRSWATKHPLDWVAP